MFQERIRRVYPFLPPSHQVIADFLLNRYQDAAFMSGSQLAQRLQVDAATVVRFSQRLGYAGYPELRQEIQERVRQEIQARYQPLSDQEEPEALFRRIIHNECEFLAQSTMLNDAQEIHHLVERLAHARRIYLLGEGIEGHLIAIFATLLKQQGMDVRVVSAGLYDTAEAILEIEPEDLLMAAFLREGGAELAAAIRLAREAGALTVALVDQPSSELARAAEMVIACPQGGPSSLSRYTCTLVTLLAIAQMLQVLHPQPAAEERSRRLRQTIAELEAARQAAHSP